MTIKKNTDIEAQRPLFVQRGLRLEPERATILGDCLAEAV